LPFCWDSMSEAAKSSSSIVAHFSGDFQRTFSPLTLISGLNVVHVRASKHSLVICEFKMKRHGDYLSPSAPDS
jgi:hypothetical protein